MEDRPQLFSELLACSHVLSTSFVLVATVTAAGPGAGLQFCARKVWGLQWGLGGQQAHGLRTPEPHGGGSQQVSEVPWSCRGAFLLGGVRGFSHREKNNSLMLGPG